MPALNKPMMARNTARNFREEQGNYLREKRISRDLTQSELAKAVGLENKSDISCYERGVSNVPPERLSAYAEALRIDPKDFAKRILSFTNPWLYALIFEPSPEHKALLPMTENAMNNPRGVRGPAIL